LQHVIENHFDRLAVMIHSVGAGIVMIDGCARVGKTRLARMLAKRLDAAAIDADCHINRGQDAFIAALRADELKTAVEAAQARSKVVLVSGVCARDIAEKLGLAPALFVYVLRKTAAGVDGDMDILDADVQHDFSCSPLDAELAEYHKRRQPRRNANILYIRVAD
jgi:hypothetical protein